MTKKTILHAGPPVTWDKMCGPVRGAVIGGLIYEGLAANKEEAEKLAASGEITFDSCHHHNAVGPMARYRNLFDACLEGRQQDLRQLRVLHRE